VVEGRDSKNCYIVFDERESVEEALKLNNSVLDGKHLRVDYAQKAKSEQGKSVV
jgi:RNA recognition motif-containing protein